MEPFVQLEGVVAPLDAVNVDTDMIIPAVYLKSIERTGFGPNLFDRYRYNEDGSENPISSSIRAPIAVPRSGVRP